MSLWFVYLLRCADGSFYTGICTDPVRREREHNHPRLGARYTRSRQPVTLVYSERAVDRSAAARREHAIKQWSHAAKQKLVEDSVRL